MPPTTLCGVCPPTRVARVARVGGASSASTPLAATSSTRVPISSSRRARRSRSSALPALPPDAIAAGFTDAAVDAVAAASAAATATDGASTFAASSMADALSDTGVPEWQIYYGAVAGLSPFVIAAYEFGKRVLIQRRCELCQGSGLIKRGRYSRKCTSCGGFLPWESWELFFTSEAGNGGALRQPKGQTSAFYDVDAATEDSRRQAAAARAAADEEDEGAEESGAGVGAEERGGSTRLDAAPRHRACFSPRAVSGFRRRPRALATRARRSRRATPPPRAIGDGAAEAAEYRLATPEERATAEAIVVKPRMTHGLDVHRRIHVRAMRQLAYMSQWRAFCERAKLDPTSYASDDDEATLCSFHFELERGLDRFEEAKRANALDDYPPRTLHPTQGFPAIQAAFYAAVAEACGGQERLFDKL